MPRSSSFSSSSRLGRQEDKSIRRGAAVIRDQITRQFNMTPTTTTAVATTKSSSSSEETDFSDVWLNTNPYGGSNNKSKSRKSAPTTTPPRLKQPNTTSPATDESLEYSLESSFGTTPDDVRTFASRGDASQWAKGSVLVSPESPPRHGALVETSSLCTPLSPEQEQALTWSPRPEQSSSSSRRSRKQQYVQQKQEEDHAGFDFIGPDYMEEFELDDYDEICHPLYSRSTQKPVLRRLTTPPATQPPLAQAPTKIKQKKTEATWDVSGTTMLNSHSASSKQNNLISTIPLEENGDSDILLFEERRQGPPSPANSSGGSIGADATRSSSRSRSTRERRTVTSSLSVQKKQPHLHHSNSGYGGLNQVPSPLSVDYEMLLQDPGYLHAQRAGHLWQSLVGQEIRFPTAWWNGARAPPLGNDEAEAWQYLGRFASADSRLKRFVKNRAAPGRLLLHIVMLDLVTCKPIQDIAVGCFHPGARGIRTTACADASYDGVRDLWLAVRKRQPGAVSVMDKHLAIGIHENNSNNSSSSSPSCKGPLGPKRKVSNANVRAVYGEAPPVETLFLPESYLYELYLQAVQKANHAVAPPVVLLEEFVLS